MNSNWTGRTPRTLSECHFSHDSAIEHYRTGDKYAWLGPIIVCAVLAIAMAVHFIRRFA